MRRTRGCDRVGKLACRRCSLRRPAAPGARIDPLLVRHHRAAEGRQARGAAARADGAHDRDLADRARHRAGHAHRARRAALSLGAGRLWHAGAAQWRHAHHARALRGRTAARRHRETQTRPALSGADPLRAAAAPARRGEAALRPLLGRVRREHRLALPSASQAPDDRLVGSGDQRELCVERGRLHHAAFLGGIAHASGLGRGAARGRRCAHHGRRRPGGSAPPTGGGSTPPYEPGLIYCRQDAYPDFTYINRPEDRQAIDRDGLVAVGDVGYFDRDGYLYIRDRKSDMVISGGVNIYPAEIEAVLITMPEVADCAVFGIPDAEFGEALAAHVQPHNGAKIEREAVRNFLKERIADYKVPRVVEFSDALP